MSDAYLIAAARTPLGKFLGSLAALSAPQCAAAALRAVIERTKLAADYWDEVLLGQVVQAGAGQAPARQAALAAGLPATTPAATVNKVCGSGLFAVMLADRAIRAGDARAILAGGMESMSQAPHLLTDARSGWKYGKRTLLDSVEHDGLRCAINDTIMGCYADALAQAAGITREVQDQWAVESHRRAVAAQAAGWFNNEIIPVTIGAGAKQTTFSADELPRPDSTPAVLAKLRPAFDPQGTATAGNSSPLSDGAAALAVTDWATAENNQSPWVFRIAAQATTAGQPNELFTAPITAIKKLLSVANWTVASVDAWEINEAFAVQTIACVNGLQLDPARVNGWGGAIALGHPIGASGARVLATLLHRLLHSGRKRGVAALCLGGGEAVAMAVERVK